MHGRAAKRLLSAFVALGAATALAATAEAQDTTQTQTTPTAQDTTPTTQTQGDTLGGDSTKWGYPVDTSGAQNPPGYRGMERDTTQGEMERTPTDTFLERQGTGAPEDTMGYSGMERDTTGADTSSADSAAVDTAAADTGAARDTTAVGDEETYQPDQPEQRLESDTIEPGTGNPEPDDSQ